MAIAHTWFYDCETEIPKMGFSLRSVRGTFEYFLTSEYVPVMSEVFGKGAFHLCFIFKRHIFKNVRGTFKI